MSWLLVARCWLLVAERCNKNVGKTVSLSLGDYYEEFRTDCLSVIDMKQDQSMNKALSITFGNASDRGLKRTENQDCYGKFPEDDLSLATPKGQLFIVADGMGGHAAGREASRMAVDIIREIYFADQSGDIPASLEQAMEAANQRIYDRANSHGEFRGMGSTCTLLVLKDDRGYIAHVGDSRAYRITRSQIEQLTQDHSKVAEMQRLGILTKAEARNHPEKSHLLRALGIAPTVQVDIIDNIPLRPGEHFLLCTDGMTKVEDAEIKRIVLANSPQPACQRLVELANQRGGADNITVQLIRIESAASKRGGGMWPAIQRLWATLD
jgi:serine/threonine protein phosphatase PrpC